MALGGIDGCEGMRLPLRAFRSPPRSTGGRRRATPMVMTLGSTHRLHGISQTEDARRGEDHYRRHIGPEHRNLQ